MNTDKNKNFYETIKNHLCSSVFICGQKNIFRLLKVKISRKQNRTRRARNDMSGVNAVEIKFVG